MGADRVWTLSALRTDSKCRVGAWRHAPLVWCGFDMFDGLTERLSGVFDRLGGRGVLSEKDIDEALREVRVALLEADVALPVVKDFISKAKESASGEAVIRSVKPADQVVKIVY